MVHRLELAAVDRDRRLGEQTPATAQHDEFATDVLDRRAVLRPEVGQRLEVRGEPANQPHQLEVLTRFPLQPARRLDPVQVTVDVDLEHRRRVVARPARVRGIHPLEPNAVVRGQYTEGTVEGEKVCAYRQEKGVSAQSVTETFAAMRLSSAARDDVFALTSGAARPVRVGRMRGQRVNVDLYPGKERQRPDRGVELGGVGRFPESPVRATSRDPPEAADPTSRGELARPNSFGGSQSLELLGIAVGGPEHLDVDEEFHRLSLPSRMRHRSMPR